MALCPVFSADPEKEQTDPDFRMPGQTFCWIKLRRCVPLEM